MAADRRITSRQNALVRRFRELATERSGPQVLLEGERLIGDALDSRVPIETLISGGGHDDLVNRARRAGAEIYEGTAAVLDAVSPVRTASGIVAIATWTPRSLEEIFADSRSKDRLLHPTILGLVDVQDPGNVGAVIRSADASAASRCSPSAGQRTPEAGRPSAARWAAPFACLSRAER